MHACTHNMYNFMNILHDCATIESLIRVRVWVRFISEIDLRDKNGNEADILAFESRKVHLLCIVANFTFWKEVATGEKEPGPSAQTRDLCSNAEFQPQEPLDQFTMSQFFISNRYRFGYICGKHSLTVCSHLVLLQKIVSYMCSILCSGYWLNNIHTLVLC